jgi:decaprenyl-phosphate phosphoribosyltransferase
LQALISAVRPRQWVKNGLIVVAPAAAGVLTRADIIRHTVAAFLAFCAISSGMYLINDLKDIEADRQHPTKRFRAIAAGQLSARVAVAAAWASPSPSPCGTPAVSSSCSACTS